MNPDDILALLACSQDRRDQGPNKELAARILSDNSLLSGLLSLLNHPDHRVINDTLHTIGFIAEEKPGLIKPYLGQLVTFIGSKNNRTVWASMITLSELVTGNEKWFFQHLAPILDAMDNGSVITRDHGMRILVNLCKKGKFKASIVPLLLEQLMMAPDNQLGQYAERMLPVLDARDIPKVIDVLSERLPDLEKEAHKRRIQKIIHKNR